MKNMQDKYSSKQTHRNYYPEGSVEEIINNSKMKAYDYMQEKNKNNLDLIATRYYGDKKDYNHLLQKIEDYAKTFKSYGIGKGDVVSIALPTMPEMMYAKYALNRIGAASYLIDPRSNPDKILEYFNKSNSVSIIAAQEVVPTKIMPIADKLRCDNIITTSASDSMNFWKLEPRVQMLYAMMIANNNFSKIKSKIKGDKFITIQDLENKYKNKFSGILDTPYEENEPFAIYNTSGTIDPTGTLKGCIASNEAYNATVEQMRIAGKDFKKGETSLSIIPMFSSFGSLVNMHNSLSNSWELILMPKFDPLKFDLYLKEHKPNSVIAVPSMWETLIKYDRVNDVDFSFLTRPVTGSAKMNITKIDEVNKFFKEHNAPDTVLKVAYGASEFGGCISATLEDHGFYRPETEGILLMGCSAMVIDPDTKEELDIGVAGELCVNTPTMMNEYIDNDEATEDITIYKDGMKYYRTGDKVYLDETGHVHIIDRYKTFIKKPDGHSIPAQPIENAVLLHPSISNCVAVGLAYDELSGTIPTVFVERNDKSKSFDEIVSILDDLCKVNLPSPDLPMAFVEVEELALTPMLKPNRKHYEGFKFEDINPVVVDDHFLDNKKHQFKKNK